MLGTTFVPRAYKWTGILYQERINRQKALGRERINGHKALGRDLVAAHRLADGGAHLAARLPVEPREPAPPLRPVIPGDASVPNLPGGAWGRVKG